MLKYRLIGYTASVIIRFLHLFVRETHLFSPGFLSQLSSGKPFIIALWHNNSLNIPPFLSRILIKKNKFSLYALVSRSKDGELAVHALKPFGFRFFRGSSSKGGAEALSIMIETAKQHSICPVLTPDGPRGPAFTLKRGVITAASETGLPVYIMATEGENMKILSSWDKIMVPLPGKLWISVEGPFTFKTAKTSGQMEKMTKELENAMNHQKDELHKLIVQNSGNEKK